MRTNNEIIISATLKDLGISPSWKGYYCLRYVIASIMDEKGAPHKCITKEIYPDTAKYLNTTSARVERAIRHAIETGWLRGNIKTQHEMFGYSVQQNRGKPTNGEFIFTVADYLLTRVNGGTDSGH